MNVNAKKYLIGGRFIYNQSDNTLIDKDNDDELIRLGSNESRTLSLLIEDPSVIITRERIHDFVWRQQGFEVDNSSLTQAISTLRKSLKESTKTPGIIKTIPKRGYQLIANVEPYYGVLPNTAEHHLPEQSVETTNFRGNRNRRPKESHETETNDTPLTKTPLKTLLSKPVVWLQCFALIAAILLPLWVNFSLPPKSASFHSMLEVDGLTVYTPNGNPGIKEWSPIITHCIVTYLKSHQGKHRPSEIIVTGGQNNQLWLNYLYDTRNSSENMTVRLLINHKDNSALCR